MRTEASVEHVNMSMTRCSRCRLPRLVSLPDAGCSIKVHHLPHGDRIMKSKLVSETSFLGSIASS